MKYEELYNVSAQQALLTQERAILKATDEADDEGTNALLSDLLQEKEKLTGCSSMVKPVRV